MLCELSISTVSGRRNLVVAPVDQRRAEEKKDQARVNHRAQRGEKPLWPSGSRLLRPKNCWTSKRRVATPMSAISQPGKAPMR